MEYVDRLHPTDHALGLVQQIQPLPLATPDCFSEVGSAMGGGKRAKLQELSTNIQQIVRPLGGSRAGQDTASSVSKAGSSECASTLAEPVAVMVHGAMMHLEAAIQRFEQLIAKQEQSPLLRWVARPNLAQTIPPSYVSEKASRMEDSERSSYADRPPSPNRQVSVGSEGTSGAESGNRVSFPAFNNKSPTRRLSVSTIMQNHNNRHSNGFVHRYIRKRFGSFIVWYENLEEPPRTGQLADIVQGKWFDTLCAAVIMCNALFTWGTTNWEIANLDKSPTLFMDVVEVLFVVFYTIELVLKVSVHRGYFFVCTEMRWNIFDTILVIVSLCDQFLSAVSAGGGGGANVTFMRALRILKMAKILRGLRVLRFFYELRLMLNSLIGSFNSLLWSIVMLCLIFYVFGLIFVQGAALHLYLHSEDMDNEDLVTLLEEFGSVQAAMLALFRTCTGGDDWVYFYRIIMMTGAPYACIFVFFIAFSHIAILNILTAIFVNNAMELARPDADTLAYEHRKKEFEAYEELQQLSESVTDQESGLISPERFAYELKFGRLGARLAVLGIAVSDADNFLELLSFTMESAQGCGIRPADFVEGCMRLRGQATGINIQGIQQETRKIGKYLQQLRAEQLAKTAQLSNALQMVLDGTGIPHAPLQI